MLSILWLKKEGQEIFLLTSFNGQDIRVTQITYVWPCRKAGDGQNNLAMPLSVQRGFTKLLILCRSAVIMNKPEIPNDHTGLLHTEGMRL